MTAAADPVALRRRGYAITILGVIWLSPDALVLRLIGGEAMDVIGWRGGLSVVTLSALLVWRDGASAGRRLAAGGWPMVAVGLLYGLNSAAFVGAIELSPAADVLVIIAATPLVAALLGWLFLRELPDRVTMAAILLGAAGVGISAVGGVAGGSPLGIALAIATVVLLAGQFTALRYWPQVDNVAAVLVGSALMGAAAWAFADPLAIQGEARGWALLLGLALTPIAFTLVSTGPRYLTSAEVSLMMLLETALGPLWVWLVLDEAPPRTALIGGAVVIAAVALSALAAARRTP